MELRQWPATLSSNNDRFASSCRNSNAFSVIHNYYTLHWLAYNLNFLCTPDSAWSRCKFSSPFSCKCAFVNNNAAVLFNHSYLDVNIYSYTGIYTVPLFTKVMFCFSLVFSLRYQWMVFNRVFTVYCFYSVALL